MPQNILQAQKERRATILKTAGALFRKYGFEKTALSDIGKAMGKTRTSVYSHFKNKEELFIAHVENETAPFFRELKEIVTAPVPAIEKVKLFNTIKFGYIRHIQKDFTEMNKEIMYNPHLKEMLSRITAEKEIKIMHGIIMSGIKSGEFKKRTFKEAKLMSIVFYTAMSAVISGLFERNDLKNFIPSSKIVEGMLISSLIK